MSWACWCTSSSPVPSTTGQQSAQSRSLGVSVARTPLWAALDTRWSLAEEGSAEGSPPPHFSATFVPAAKATLMSSDK